MRSKPEQVIRLLIRNGAKDLHFQTHFDLFRCLCEADPNITLLICKTSHRNFDKIRKCVGQYSYFGSKLPAKVKIFISQPLPFTDQLRIFIYERKIVSDHLPVKLENYISFHNDL